MRWKEITESAHSNIMLLSAMVTEILLQVTYTVEKHRATMVKSPFSPAFIDKIFKQSPEYGELCVYINQYVPIYFINQNGGGLKGAYSHSAAKGNSMRDDISIYLQPALPDSPAQRPNDIRNSKEIATTLLHELRHVMQRQAFGDFYHKYAQQKAYSDTSTYNYRKDPIEIDAAFMHHLYDENADDIHGFVNSVMARFSKYKDLTPKQTEHYRRQAAKYFYSRQAGPDKESTTPKDRLSAKAEAKWQAERKTILDFNITPLDDLRNIGHPSEGRFFFPAKSFRDALASLMDGKEMPEHNRYLAIVFLSLMMEVDDTLPAAAVLKHCGMNIDDVIKFAETYHFSGFSKEFFLKCLEDLKRTLDGNDAVGGKTEL